MELVAEAQAKATGNLILRAGPSTNYRWLATIQKDVIVHVLAKPVKGWAKVWVGGWVSEAYPGKVFSEDHKDSSLQALRTAAVSWEYKVFEGWVSTKYLKAIDGPKKLP